MGMLAVWTLILDYCLIL